MLRKSSYIKRGCYPHLLNDLMYTGVYVLYSGNLDSVYGGADVVMFFMSLW